MQLILAIDSDPRRSEQLAALVRTRLQVDLVQATSAGEGLQALRDRVPDLILTSPLLSPFDDGVLDEYLRDLGSAATHVQTLRIPMLSSGPKKKSAATRLFSLGRKKAPTSPASPDGCDPKVFADEITHYLTRSLESRSAPATPAAPWAQSAPQSASTAEIVASSREPAAEDWGAPDALVQEFRERTPSPWAEPEPADAAPAANDLSLSGSIFGLRTPRANPPVPESAVDPEPIGAGEGEPFDLLQDGPADFAHVEPAFIEPDPIVDAEPITDASPEPMPFEEERAAAFDTGRTPVADRVEPAPRVAPRVEPAPRVAPPGSPGTQTPPAVSGNSASFEAALAAIRAAWATPAPPTPSSAGPDSPSRGRDSHAGSGEVDLTDSLEDRTGITQPEQPRGRRAEGVDGRSDWGVLDPNQYEFSALVNTLDEVTDSAKVTNRATNRR